jgi:uridine phosphorylase
MDTNLQPHIRLGIEHTASFALLPGDPQRVDRVRAFLDNPVEVSFNREFKSVLGYYKGVKILVTSTGIGGPSTVIAVEELKNVGVSTLIRIGSCGALQCNIKLGDLIIATGAVRNDGASKTYIESSFPAVPDITVLMTLVNTASELNYRHHCGIIRSHDSFYTDDEKNIDGFWSSKGVLASDMESASLMVVGKLRGLKTASILNVVVENTGGLEDSINNYVSGENETSKGEEREIILALESIVKLDSLKNNNF